MALTNFRKTALRGLLSTTACIVAVTAFPCKGFSAPEGGLVVGGGGSY